jgi:flagellar biosynthesis/type III secretory pathway M-ring protein FliF/YscJ
MTIMESWVATALFCLLVFFVGLALQMKEKRDRMARKVDAIEKEFGPPHGRERRKGERRQSTHSAPTDAVVQQR